MPQREPDLLDEAISIFKVAALTLAISAVVLAVVAL